MVAYIGKLAVDRRGWLDRPTFSRGVALCQTIPGATAMQAAAYVGLKVRGVSGAVAAYSGFGLPAFVLMVALSASYLRFHELSAAASAFAGLRVLVVAIAASAAYSFGRASLKRWPQAIVALFAAVLFYLKVNPILVILVAALLGLTMRVPVAEAKPDETASGRTGPGLLLLLAVAAAALALLFLLRRDLFSLSLLFLRIDLFAFGGGFSSVPLMLHEVVDVRSWLDTRTFLDGIALGQVTPGPIVITATFVGYLLYGPLGAIVATASVFFPSFALVVGLTPHWESLSRSPVFRRMLTGILSSFVGLLLSVTLSFGLAVEWTWVKALLGAVALTALLLKVDILWVVLGGTLLSVALLR
jgi:chromate transporter